MTLLKQLLLIIILTVSSYTYGQDEILGKWLPADKLGQIEIFKKNNKYFGKIVCIYNPINPETGKIWQDINNPDKSKRNRTVLGLIMMFDFEYDKKNKEYINGKLYDVRTGKTYKGKMWLEDGKLVLRGYWFIFYQTEIWIRIKKPCG